MSIRPLDAALRRYEADLATATGAADAQLQAEQATVRLLRTCEGLALPAHVSGALAIDAATATGDAALLTHVRATVDRIVRGTVERD